jgi:DNA polymerase-3 subunit delta'
MSSIDNADIGMPPWLQAQLVNLRQQRGHALLLAGPPGLGQYPLALALARAWLCEQPTPAGACGHCTSCHAVDVRTHADLFVLMPETLSIELGWPLDEKTQDKIDKKEIKASKFIRVDATREAVAFTQYTRSRGDTKVVLIYPAERLNVESANTLLKTLEEPPGAVRFILATEAAHALLPTIRSRCLSHAMVWPSNTEAMQWLAQVAGVEGLKASTADLATWLRAAGGRPDEALDWLHLGAAANTWGRLPKAVAAGDFSLMTGWPPGRQMDVLQKICHDLMVLGADGAPRFFEASDLPPLPHQQALVEWHRWLRQATRTMEHPFSPALMQEAWAARAHEALAIH